MDENKTYSAEDLLRYAHGQMPVAERHALEKAALDDPFLAEALDGYLETTDDKRQITIPQLKEVRQFIAEKAADKKEKKLAPVLFIAADKWLQRALAAIIIVGGAWWLYSISNRPKENITVAKTEQVAPAQSPIVQDSAMVNVAPKQESTTVLADAAISKPKETIPKQIKAAPGVVKNDVLANEIAPTAAPIALADSAYKSKDVIALDEKAFQTDKNNYFKKEAKTVVVGYGAQRKTAAPELESVVVVPKKPSFVFQGRILDANNNPLPFSSVMVPGENFGTYSDGQGYFNFVYSDSVLPVHAKSIGFEAQDFNMRSNTKENRIVLNEDKNLDKNLTFMRSEKQKARANFQPTIVKLDTISSTVEPYVGWNNYSLYLTNNNRLSDFQLPANNTNRSVMLSFEVAQDGGIKNITVDKSLGKDLDAEAIRLLKEGPKWKVKRNGEKGKVEVKF